DGRFMEPLVQHLADVDWRARASLLFAIAELARLAPHDAHAQEFAAALLVDAHPLVREAAATALDSLGLGAQASLLAPALADPVPAVRLAAMRRAAPRQGPAARAAPGARRKDRVEVVRVEALHAARSGVG